MAAFAASFLSSFPSSSSSSLPFHLNRHVSSFPVVRFPKGSLHVKTLVFASSSSSSSDGIRPYEGDSRSKEKVCSLRTTSAEEEVGQTSAVCKKITKSVLLKLIQEIEPLDVSVIQKDVPPTTVDAMKRTISGMLGLLPSDQFQVLIEALWKPLSKLLVSSLMTGYTLRNAEYRLCLEKNFDTDEDKQPIEDSKSPVLLNSDILINTPAGQDEELHKSSENTYEIPDLGQMTPEVQQYILELQSRLSSVRKELHEVKRKNAALHMQQFVGEEKNELLDYLRSLQPEKVAELSEPTSADLKETINSVVHGLLATLSPKMHSQAPLISENTSIGVANNGAGGNDAVDNTSMQFQPLVSLSRDYLARLLFWCMLLGHYLRGLEYRVELMDLLSLSQNDDSDS